MSAMDTVKIVDGFSLTNRWLLYTSMMLAPAQYVSGIGNNCPSNIGFLAYNWYSQIVWYRAIRAKQLHALSLLPVHFNLLNAITYLGGVSSGNIVMAVILGLGSAGVMILNTVSAWISWNTNLREGFGEYQFFFFGWRTLTSGWHIFFLLWQISDSMMALSFLMVAVRLSYAALNSKVEKGEKAPWYYNTFIMIPVGAAIVMLGLGWALILWTELIVNRNKIESDTDMVAVWLFIAQVVPLVLPKASTIFGCIPGLFKRSSERA